MSSPGSHPPWMPPTSHPSLILPVCLPRSPMWWCPSCLSMRWTSSTRCQDTCWTWMTRQALWLPWQRQCWLAVSPRLVFHWQVPRSSEGEPRDYYLQADLSQTHSYHHHCAACPSAWHYLHYVLRRSSRFNARCPLVRVGSFSYDTYVLSRRTAAWCISEVVKLMPWIC